MTRSLAKVVQKKPCTYRMGGCFPKIGSRMPRNMKEEATEPDLPEGETRYLQHNCTWYIVLDPFLSVEILCLVIFMGLSPWHIYST